MTLKLLGIVLILLATGAGLCVSGRVSHWVHGGIAGILGFGGLFLAAGSGVKGPIGYNGGLALFMISVLLIFYLEKIAFDEADRRMDALAEAPTLARASRPFIRPYIKPYIELGTAKNALALVLVLVTIGTVAFHFLSPWWLTPIASNWGYVDNTIIITFWITGVVFVAIVLFMAYCVFRYRYQEGRRSAYDPENKKLEWWLTGLTALGVAGMLTPGLFVWDQFVTVPKDAAVVEVFGQQWQFSFRLPGKGGVLGTFDSRYVSPENPFGLNPNDPNGKDNVLIENGELHLPRGRPVKFLLRSVDVMHDFYVPEFRAKMDMVPGMVTYYWFTPTRNGTFDALCVALCGVGHYGMRARVVVEDESAYQTWLNEQPTFARLSAQAGSNAAKK